MDTLKLGAKVTTPEPRVAGDPQLPPGTYRIQLIVKGQQAVSKPATLILKVVATR